MDPKLLEIQKLLDSADASLSSARNMMREMVGTEVPPLDLDKKLEAVNPPTDEGKVIEGVFDGESMTAADGQTYPVPPNYASKSKLVEGDTMKLTIAADGSFVFKQIMPVERRNTVGTLAQDGGSYTISAEGKSYKVLTASVTFYKAVPGDQITIVLPKEHEANWAVMENVIKKPETTETPEVAEAPTTPAPEAAVPAQEVVEPPVVAEKVVTPPINDVPAAVEPFVEDKGIILPEDTTTTPAEPETVPTPAEPAADTSQLLGNREATIPATETPQIEFPSGASTLTDEQLLENLKNNLQKLDQPAYTAPQDATPATPKPVDNVVANDMAALDNQQSATSNQPVANDKPIAELDI
jgi:hypothetical protein